MGSPSGAIVLALFIFILPSAAQPSETRHSCSGRLFLLLPCLPFVQGVAASPPAACCQGLAAVFVTRPDCACAALDHAANFPVNRTLARQLPLACNLDGGNSACGGNEAFVSLSDSSLCHEPFIFSHYHFFSVINLVVSLTNPFTRLSIRCNVTCLLN